MVEYRLPLIDLKSIVVQCGYCSGGLSVKCLYLSQAPEKSKIFAIAIFAAQLIVFSTVVRVSVVL